MFYPDFIFNMMHCTTENNNSAVTAYCTNLVIQNGGCHSLKFPS